MTKKNEFRCNICDSEKVKILYTILGYPMCGGPMANPDMTIKVARDKIILGFCVKCGSCSLVYPPAEKLAAKIYDNSYTSSNMAVALGAAVDIKRKNFIQLVSNLKMKKGAKLLEIGCYDGSLLMQFKKMGFDVSGCEPSPMAKIGIERWGLNIKNDYFSADLYTPDYFDIVILRNILEHIPYPVSFLCSVRKVLKRGGFVAIEVPDGQKRIAEGILGSIVPEHPNYFGDYNLKMIFCACGFSEFRIKKQLGSLLLAPQKNTLPGEKLPLKLRLAPPKILKKFLNSYRSGIKKNLERHAKTLALLKNEIKNGRKVMIFGANTHSLELLVQKSIKRDWVLCAIDDDPVKWGRRMVVFNIPVYSRKTLKNYKNYVLVICSYFFQNSIIHSLVKELPRLPKIIKFYPGVGLVQRF